MILFLYCWSWFQTPPSFALCIASCSRFLTWSLHSLPLNAAVRRKNDWLVVEEKPLWKIWKSIGMMTYPIYGKIKNVPNHQPAIKTHDSQGSGEQGSVVMKFTQESLQRQLIPSRRPISVTIGVSPSENSHKLTVCCLFSAANAIENLGSRRV